MKEIKAEIFPLQSVSYDEILEVLSGSLPNDRTERSDFLDSIHHYFFSPLSDGIILKIENHFCGFLIFSKTNLNEIQVIAANQSLIPKKTLGLLLNYHTEKYKISAQKLQFRVWSHQTELIMFLKESK